MNTDTVARRLFETSLGDFEWLCHQEVCSLQDYVQSEIELLFLAAVETTNYAAPNSFHIVQGDTDHSSPARCIVRTQFPWRNFKIDFCFQPKRAPFCVFVECDGHDFHERTPEQAERDRSKDRLIQSEGIPIFRFTGREIWRYPVGCVTEVLKFIVRRMAP